MFIAAEAVPLFRPSHFGSPAVSALPTAVGLPANAALQAIGTDEYRRYLYAVEPDGRVAFYEFASGKPAQSFPIVALEGAQVVSSSHGVLGNYIAAGTADGRVALGQIRYTPQFENQSLKDLTIDVRDRGVVAIDPALRPVRRVSYTEHEGVKLVAALVGEREVAYWWTDTEGAEHRARLEVPSAAITELQMSRSGAVIAGTSQGKVYHWSAPPDLQLTDVSPVDDQPITALEWLLGGGSFVAGTASGAVSSWFRAPIDAEGTLAMVRAHDFERQGSAVVGFAVSGRDRSFASLGADGAVLLRHQTSERTLASLPPRAGATAVLDDAQE